MGGNGRGGVLDVCMNGCKAWLGSGFVDGVCRKQKDSARSDVLMVQMVGDFRLPVAGMRVGTVRDKRT